jgi:hypothetical protein
MKRIFILTAIIMCIFGSVAYAASMHGEFNGNPVVKVISENTELRVNGTPAMMYNNNVLIPINMLRQFGATVDWNSTTYSVDVALQDAGLEAFKFSKLKGGSIVTYSYYDQHYYVSTDYYYKKGPEKDWPEMLEILKKLSSSKADYLQVDYYDEDHYYLDSISIDRISILDLIAGKKTEADIVSARSTNGRMYDPPMTPREIAKLIDRVGYLVSYDKSGSPISQGSGFLLSDGLFITNSHVVDGGYSEKVTINNNTYDNQGWYLFLNPHSDLYGFVLSTAYSQEGKPTGSKPTQTLEYTTALPEIGEKIYAIGSPRGLENTLTEGIVSGIRRIDGIKYIQHTAAIEPGSSGGVLLNEYGKVIGVNTWKVEDSSLYFAVPMIYVQQELDILSLE